MPVFSGALLRAQRLNHGLRLDWVAAKAGISLSAMYKFEAGEIAPSAATLGRLAGVIRCSVADFFADDEQIGGAA